MGLPVFHRGTLNRQDRSRLCDPTTSDYERTAFPDLAGGVSGVCQSGIS